MRAALAAAAAICAAAVLCAAAAVPADAAPEAAAPASPQAARIEARSADLLAVGTVRGDRMTIHVSRIIDNAPVRDAVVTVLLRGPTHPTTAETDGSYSLQAPDLNLPGAAAMEFQVVQAGGSEALKGTLRIADAPPKPEDKNNARQLLWWVLNFAVCIGILMLWSRRKAARTDEA
jgi:cobalt-zinc-cadmium efflux system membrane fusion protein